MWHLKNHKWLACWFILTPTQLKSELWNPAWVEHSRTLRTSKILIYLCRLHFPQYSWNCLLWFFAWSWRNTHCEKKNADFLGKILSLIYKSKRKSKLVQILLSALLYSFFSETFFSFCWEEFFHLYIVFYWMNIEGYQW